MRAHDRAAPIVRRGPSEFSGAALALVREHP